MRLPAQLLRRRTDANKKDFGHVFVLAGSASMLGAAALTAISALRSGAGLVSVGVAKSLNAVLQKKISNEVMTKPLPQNRDNSIALSSFSEIKKFSQKADCLAIGPGLSRNKFTQALVRKIIKEIDTFATHKPRHEWRGSKGSLSINPEPVEWVDLPMVIDADALNALAGKLNLLQVMMDDGRGTRILTPHAGEMARLLNTNVDEVQRKRKDIAKSFAKKYNCILVLKGNKTVVADNKGNVYVNNTGNPGMATAGSGDVLTGIISSFLAQGLKPFEAAKYAVYLHGLAGDLAAKKQTQISLIASDIIEKIPEAIKKCS